MADLKQDIEGLDFGKKLHVLHELLVSLGGESMPYASSQITALGVDAARGELRHINALCGSMPRWGGERAIGRNEPPKVVKRPDGIAPNALVPSHQFRSEDSSEPDWNQPYLYTTGAMLNVIDPVSPALTRIVTGDHDMGVGYAVPDLQLVKKHIAALQDLSAYANKVDKTVEAMKAEKPYEGQHPTNTDIHAYKHTLSVIEQVAKSISTDLEGKMGELYQIKVDELLQAEKDASQKVEKFKTEAGERGQALAEKSLLQRAIDRAAQRGLGGAGRR